MAQKSAVWTLVGLLAALIGMIAGAITIYEFSKWVEVPNVIGLERMRAEDRLWLKDLEVGKVTSKSYDSTNRADMGKTVVLAQGGLERALVRKGTRVPLHIKTYRIVHAPFPEEVLASVLEKSVHETAERSREEQLRHRQRREEMRSQEQPRSEQRRDTIDLWNSGCFCVLEFENGAKGGLEFSKAIDDHSVPFWELNFPGKATGKFTSSEWGPASWNIQNHELTLPNIRVHFRGRKIIWDVTFQLWAGPTWEDATASYQHHVSDIVTRGTAWCGPVSNRPTSPPVSK
jgi:hypothetical protein